MTITSDAENKFVYDQIFKAEKEQAGMTSDDFGSWIGGTRVKPKADESAEPSEASDSEANAGAMKMKVQNLWKVRHTITTLILGLRPKMNMRVIETTGCGLVVLKQERFSIQL